MAVAWVLSGYELFITVRLQVCLPLCVFFNPLFIIIRSRRIRRDQLIIHITKKKIIMAKKSNKFNLWVSIVLILVGCVLACSSIISNDYLKLVVVLASLAYGLYGIMKALSTSEEADVLNK